jgi:hypothetical protein
MRSITCTAKSTLDGRALPKEFEYPAFPGEHANSSSMRDPRGSLPEMDGLTFSLGLRADYVARLVSKFERTTLADVVNGVRYIHGWEEHQTASDDINQ